jgi:aminopeptidase N
MHLATPWRPLIIGALLSLSLSAPVMPASDEVPRGRLPGLAEPVAYRLDLTVVPDEERFSGHAEIDIVVKAATRSLYLHGRDLKMTSATVISGGRQSAITYTQANELGTARLDFAQELPAGPATLLFDYDAPFGDSAAGLYRIKVGDDWYAWTQLQSIEGRAAFPSFDEPGFKTPFTVSLTTKPGYLALSNAPETGSPVTAGALVKHRFAPTLPLPTYLVAFVVGPFIVAEGVAPPTTLRNRPLPLRIVATRNHAGRLDYALRETPRIVELLEDYFGQPFPFPKLDQIASPVMPGAMENAGADIYGDNILLLEDGAPTSQKQIFGMVVAHELSHQWFGDLVTPVWWDDIWLNESFANWMGYRIGNEWRPELNIGVGALQEGLEAMDTDALQVGRPIQEPILTDGEIDSAFDEVTYGKGGQIVAMIANYLGDERFREGVRLHLRRRPYGNANSEDFFSALASAAGDPRVLTAMRSFVSQQGFPLVDIQPEGDGYRATQSRFLPPGAAASTQQWVVPFCLRRGDESTCTLLDKPQQLIKLKGTAPLVPNAGGTGYYRYNLASADWDALIALGASLPASEALAAEDSLWAQFESGKVSATQLLRAVRTFAGNPDSNVALTLGQQLAAWHRRGVLPDAALADYHRVMNDVYGRKLAAMGLDAAAGAHARDTPDVQKLRQELLPLAAHEGRDAASRQLLRQAATSYLAGDEKALDPAFLGSALGVLLQDGDRAATQMLYERMVTGSDELFRAAALGALGGTGRKPDANWLIAQLGDARLRSSDRLQLMRGLMRNLQTRDLAFDWLKGNYDAFTKGTGLYGTISAPQLPGGFCSVKKAAEIERLLLPRVRASGRGELPFQRMLERIRSCEAIRQGRSAEMAAALKRADTMHH